MWGGPQCSFDLHFSNNEWCWVSFHVPICHLYVFSEEMSLRSSAHFSLGLFVFCCCYCERWFRLSGGWRLSLGFSCNLVFGCHHLSCYCCSVTKSCPALCSPTDCSTTGSSVLHYLHKVCSDLCTLSRQCRPTISSSVVPFSCFQSFPASGSFPTSGLFTSVGQSIGTSASASVLPVNIQGLIFFRIDWFALLAVQSTFKSLCVQIDLF